MEAVEDADDALAQGRSAHDAVVDDDEVVHARLQAAVGHVIYVGGQVGAAVALGDEGAEFDVLDGHLLTAHPHTQDMLNLLFAALLVNQFAQAVALQAVEVDVQSFDQAEEGHLGRIGNVGDDGVLDVVVHGGQNLVHQSAAQLLALLVDVLIAAAAEIDALEGAGLQGLGRVDLLEADAAVLTREEGLTRLEFVNTFKGHVEHRLDDGSLGGEDEDFVVLVPEGGADAPGVAQGKGFAAARHATHDVAAIPERAARAQYVGNVHAGLDGVGEVEPRASLGHADIEDALHLAVQAVAHLFEEDMRVGIFARMLSVGHDAAKDFVHIRQVEVAAERQVLGAPVVAAQEGVDIVQPALARGGIAQVAHVEFADEGREGFGAAGGGFRRAGLLLVHLIENLGDGRGASGTFAKHILVAGFGTQSHAGNARALLSAVVLLLHEEIEFVEGILRGAVFLLVVVERLAQAYHGHAAFVFERFHCVYC